MNKQIFYRNSKNKNYILRNIKPGKLCTILDVETTGLNDIAEIIQFSAIQIEINNDYSFSEIDRMNVYIKPNTPVPKKITEITGITNDMLINEKTETEVFSSIRDFIKGSIIVGHNIQFDYSKIQEMFKRNGMLFIAPAIIDTLEMSRDINPKRSHKLSDLAHDYGIDAPRDTGPAPPDGSGAPPWGESECQIPAPESPPGGFRRFAPRSAGAPQ